MILILPLVALFVVVVLAMIFRYSFADMEKNKAEQKTVEDIMARLGEVMEKQKELDNRLTNIEHIVADDRFIAPLEPKESIIVIIYFVVLLYVFERISNV